MYSVNHKSLDEVKDGVTIGVSQDAVNQERAVRLIEELGWVKIKGDAEVINFNVNSVEPAKYKVNFKVLNSAQILVSLKDLDFGIVNGNFITDAGKKISDALKIENTPEHYRIVVTLNKAN